MITNGGWSALQNTQFTDVNGAFVTIGSGISRQFVLVVGWSDQTVNPNVQVSIGGQSAVRSAHSTIGGNGVDIFTWSESAIAAMSDLKIVETSGSYSPGNLGWAFVTLSGVDQTAGINPQGFGQGITTATVDSPAPGACDYGILAASQTTGSAAFTGHTPSAYTVQIEGSAGGIRAIVCDATSRPSESPTVTCSTQDIKAVVLGFNVSLGIPPQPVIGRRRQFFVDDTLVLVP